MIGRANGQGTIQVDTAGRLVVRLGTTDSAAPGTRSHCLAKRPASGDGDSIPGGGGVTGFVHVTDMTFKVQA